MTGPRIESDPGETTSRPPETSDAPGSEESGIPTGVPTSRRRRDEIVRALGFRNLSLLYVGIALTVLFAIWIPDTWLTSTTWKTILNEQAIVALAALALLVPVCAGAFDLSVGWALGFGAILIAWLLVDQHVAVVPAVGLAVLAGALIGVVNGFLVVAVRIDSFIATLGVGSILSAMTSMISSNQQIIGLPASFQNIALSNIGGVTLPIFYLLAIALTLWYVLEHTPAGRRLYATGGGREAARLAGVKTGRILFVAFVVGGMIATLAGLLLTARLTAGSPGIGASYLLPAFAAVFLGSTQVVPGRFNVWGTLLGVYVLAIGVKGLQLAGAPFWLPDFFNGAALIIAVGLSGAVSGGRWWRWRRRAKAGPA